VFIGLERGERRVRGEEEESERRARRRARGKREEIERRRGDREESERRARGASERAGEERGDILFYVEKCVDSPQRRHAFVCWFCGVS
jgi:hypothetical protein